MIRADPSSPEAYMGSCRRLAEEHFAGLSLAEVRARADDFNAYPGLARLEPARGVLIMEDSLPAGGAEAARRAALEGLALWQHAAAGEGLRLGGGPKYLLDPRRAGGDPASAFMLGERRLGQWALEMTRLAGDYGLDPAEVLARQTILLIVAAESRAVITGRLAKAGFLGLKPENFLFMEQAAFPGLRPEGGWHFSAAAPRRPHNHGHLAMQMTMEDQIFHLDGSGREIRLGREEFFSRLRRAAVMAAYNIEDLGYLTQALDFEALGLVLALGEKGFGMVMEIVPNNPVNPVKGGFCAFDPALNRDVLVESQRLRGLAPARIERLNKNFNHYPRPAEVFSRLAEEGLFPPVSAPEEGLYFQPAVGDLNFLTSAAFFVRRRPAPLQGWKSPADDPAALAAAERQDAQPGFAEFMRARFG